MAMSIYTTENKGTRRTRDTKRTRDTMETREKQIMMDGWMLWVTIKGIRGVIHDTRPAVPREEEEESINRYKSPRNAKISCYTDCQMEIRQIERSKGPICHLNPSINWWMVAGSSDPIGALYSIQRRPLDIAHPNRGSVFKVGNV
ncbi:hypothetical protein K435DRAFT_795854 [Dendrothele bispora CBS 962.96]|uniref:Uncharacterized protein n=1 Tax=Dendrothele bispora (strain CBS 962.96) TaxID=1314807 RepID=A0A4S8M7B1_DENBC|nr:hypothetical protein K435DRAFT_795854 [Dendrothele bispora CBS 962.96]